MADRSRSPYNGPSHEACCDLWITAKLGSQSTHHNQPRCLSMTKKFVRTQLSSRRLFLQRALSASAAGVVAPYFVPATALAGAGRVGANDRIGIGTIGCGRRSAQLRNLPPAGQIVAAADCHLGRARQVAEKYQGKAYQDYRELLDSPAVDAVIVASPDHWHALHTIHACQAGKDVYVEKPMTLTVREGRLMVEAARANERVVQVGSQQRSMPTNVQACKWVREGAVGKIEQVIAHNYPSPWICSLPAVETPAELNWDMWCGQTEVRPYHPDIFIPRAKPGWISFRRYSGGEMTGWGAHGLDQVQLALGASATGPVEIWTEGPPYAPPTFTQPEGRVDAGRTCSQPLIFMRYADDTLLTLGNGPPGGAIFIGERGRITIDRGTCRVEPEALARSLGPLENSGRESHMENWFACLASRQRPAADVEIGHRSTTLCHLGNIARWTGRRLQWDPEQESFVGDAEADQLLQRTQRKGYELPT